MRRLPYILAVDIGSSAVKAGVYDADGRVLGHTLVSVGHEQRVAGDGTHEEDAELIQRVTELAIDRVLDLAEEEGEHIAAVGFDAMASTILGVDARHEPVTPVYTYADTRTASDVDALQGVVDVAGAYQRTGVMQHTSYVPGRVMWLRRTDPERFERVAKWTDISTFIFSRWFGSTEVPASYSVSAWSGLLNRHELDWDPGMLDAVGIERSNCLGWRLTVRDRWDCVRCIRCGGRSWRGCRLLGCRRWCGGEYRVWVHESSEYRVDGGDDGGDAVGGGPPG